MMDAISIIPEAVVKPLPGVEAGYVRSRESVRMPRVRLMKQFPSKVGAAWYSPVTVCPGRGTRRSLPDESLRGARRPAMLDGETQGEPAHATVRRLALDALAPDLGPALEIGVEHFGGDLIPA